MSDPWLTGMDVVLVQFCLPLRVILDIYIG